MKNRFISHASLFKGLVGCLIIVAAGLAFSLTLPSRTEAISATSFNAGRIVDDGIFFKSDTMSVQQIQNFLNAKLPTCDTNGTKPSGRSGYPTRADWGRANNQPPPYTCLKSYSQAVPNTTDSGSGYCGNISGGTKSAAQIIYDVSRACGINPHALIVLLQKEQGLVTDEWPWTTQYRSATGYGCPDTAPCDAEYYGFFNQVYQAARAYKRYAANPTNYNYRAGRNNTVYWNPNAGCGSSTVYIENQATAGLYIYTPYRPNQAALNAGYGTGDGCSSYGNRNFFLYFSDWFGTTYGGVWIDWIKANEDIDATYNSYQSQLGNSTSGRIPEYNTDGRVWQEFENGTIIWTKDYGAHAVIAGDIYARWKLLGGSLGTLGVPTNQPITETDDGRVWQDFRLGTVIYSSGNGAWEILPGPIGDKWRSVGGSRGLLGRPTSEVTITNEMRKQVFENGAVVRKNLKSPAYTIANNTYSLWQSNQSILNLPTMDGMQEAGNGRIWQYFDGGLVIESNGSAWIIRSGIFHNTWKQLGGSLGKLGKPVSNQVTESNGRTWQEFEKGYLIQKNAKSPAHEILFGDIYDRWKQIGGSSGDLGTPQGSAFTETDGRRWQDFENGTIIWSQETGAWDVVGGFYTFWRQNGGSLGALGKPTSGRVIETDGRRWQDFENGKATWRDGTGWSVSWL